MSPKQRKHFNNLWKVKIFDTLRKMEEGNITREIQSDNLRSIKLIEYGFLAGINFNQMEKKNVKQKSQSAYKS